MAITLYNTRTRRKEALQPIDPQNVRMYVCGPTVYDRAHIGNARPVVVFDVLYRLLRHEYGVENVKYARNFTDVDDKINAKAAETGRSIRDITDETIAWYHEDMDALGALRPDYEPRATEYIAQMVAMIDGLIASGHAYEAEGHVLFAVSTDPDYGSLSRRSLDEMRAGARVEVAPYKRDPMDFVLWKPSTGEQPGWDSPWGRGRPGWHIECSAMAGELFGERFDIHGGGIDLAFPHHENECAQSRCAGHDFANVWMHNGYLMVEGEKMSKSLGNFFTVADLRAKGVPGEVMRLAMLMTHYRKPIDWTNQRLSEAHSYVKRLHKVYNIAKAMQRVGDVSININENSLLNNFLSALKDDLNTPAALNVLDRMVASRNYSEVIFVTEFMGLSKSVYANNSLIKKVISALDDIENIAVNDVELNKLSQSFGVLNDLSRKELLSSLRNAKKFISNLEHLLSKNDADQVKYLDGNKSYKNDYQINAMIKRRAIAKMNRDFQLADKIRDNLKSMGVVVIDHADGVDWKYE